ncbi:MAG: thermonuclease family protein [Croceibacterium sp.]
MAKPFLFVFALVPITTLAAAPTPILAAQPARFAPCGAGPRVDCVVDGDTFWLSGAKIRIADINTPETGGAACPAEAALGHAATARLTALLNAGPFTLAPWSAANGRVRERDRYGRLLRVVERYGHSLGGALVSEGLAEPWRGKRGTWC